MDSLRNKKQRRISWLSIWPAIFNTRDEFREMIEDFRWVKVTVRTNNSIFSSTLSHGFHGCWRACRRVHRPLAPPCAVSSHVGNMGHTTRKCCYPRIFRSHYCHSVRLKSPRRLQLWHAGHHQQQSLHPCCCCACCRHRKWPAIVKGR